jgi:general stress protein CsbA
MTNINLLYSSIFFGIILLYFCCKYNDNKLLIILTIVGVHTSILNHMYENDCLQYIDRLTMIIGFIYLSKNNYQVLTLLLLTILLYFLAKYTENDIFHFHAHFLITITIILLLTNKI